MLVFDVEMMEMEEGLPEGYMFVWNSDVSPDLFSEMDKNKDKEVDRTEVNPYLTLCLCVFNPYITKVFFFFLQFSEYILQQVEEGKGRLAPGFDQQRIIDNMYDNQDRNKDGQITEAEFKLKADEPVHDEL